MKKKTDLWNKIDWKTTLFPLAGILILSVLFMVMPEQSKLVLGAIRGFLGDDLGFYYILIGLGTFLFSLYIAFSKYGNIRLGNTDKPQYSTFQWGTMIFTSTMAADILYYSLCEWALYAADPHVEEMGGIQEWASVYPLFHWGPIPWSFYIILAISFGFMLHVRGRKRQRFSEACRPVFRRQGRRFLGKGDRYHRGTGAFSRYGDNLFAGDTAFIRGNQPCIWSGCDDRADNRNSVANRIRLYADGVVRYEGGLKTGVLLYLSVFCPADLFSDWRRRDKIYH